jgi:hypothetical protein
MRRGLCIIGSLVAVVLLVRPCGAQDFQSVGLYQSVDEFNVWVQDFAAANSDVVKLVEFGRSYEDRPLLALQFSDTPGVNVATRPEFLFTGGIHAREVVSSQAASQLAEALIAGYRSGSEDVTEVFATREVWIVPHVNPDGRIRVESGMSEHRKNAQPYPPQDPSNTGLGVDLNRNFPHRWAEDTSQFVTYPTYNTYRGPAVLSEPESAGLWNMLQDTQYFSDLTGAIDYHSGLRAVITPWVTPQENVDYPVPSGDRQVLDYARDEIFDIMGLSRNPTLYKAYGTLSDSLYEEFGTYAVTQELYVDSSEWYNFFVRYNPTSESELEAILDEAVDSAMFMLTDPAFVPEPASVSILALGAAVLCGRRRRR